MEPDLAAMGADQLRRDCQAKPHAAGLRRTLESLEQPGADALWNAGAIVLHLDHHHRALAPGGDDDPAVLTMLARVQCLDCVANEVGEHPVQVFAVGIDEEARWCRIKILKITYVIRYLDR